MELTRYWRAKHNGAAIEVQWTGFRFHGGWTLRLLVNGELKAERRVGRFANNFKLRDGPVAVNFWAKAFRHRCAITADGKLLTESSQPWNLLAFAVIFSPLVLALILRIAGALMAR